MTLETIKTALWNEEPEPDNPFAARRCFCAGYDVYGEVLQRASYIEYLFLLMTGAKATRAQARALEIIAIALANPGPRDAMVHAAMSAGVGGSTHASCLMAALAVGAGQHGGAHELALAMDVFQVCGTDLNVWQTRLRGGYKKAYPDGWGDMDYFPGFDPVGQRCALPVRQTLSALTACNTGAMIKFVADQQSLLEFSAGYPLSMIGVCAAAFVDLGMTAAQTEMLSLFLRLPGAAAHALEQEKLGWKHFPFFSDVVKLQGTDTVVATTPMMEEA